MKRFIIVSLLALVGWAIYQVWSNNRESVVTHTERTTTTVERYGPPIQRLSGFVDANLDHIFTPLTEKDTIVPTQEIVQIRATLKDLAKTKNDRDRRLYSVGLILCDEMLHAISRREEHAKRLADSSAKPPSMALFGNREEDIQRAWQIFNNGIIRSWETEARPLRDRIRETYDYMRLLER